LHYLRDEGAHTELPKVPNFPFDPDTRVKKFWDILVMLVLLYTCFAVPVVLAFGGGIDPTAPLSAYDIWDLCVDFFLSFDIMVCFCTCYVSQGVYVRDLRRIVRHYLLTWFPIDFSGGIPFDKIIAYSAPHMDLGPALKTMKFIRMLKMLRAFRFLKKLDDLEERDQTGVLRTFFTVFRSIFIMLISAHFLGCVFVVIRDSNLEKNGSDNWMDAYDSELRDAASFDQYVASLYWSFATISTIGYGDVGPVNHEERIYTIFVAICGVILFAFSMGNVTNCLQNAEGVRHRFDDRLRQVQDYITFRDVKPTLKRRIMTHFGGTWRNSGDLYQESEIVNHFPPYVKKLYFEHLSINALVKVPLLKGFDTDTVGQIFIMLEPMHFEKGEIVYKGGEPGGCMHFVTVGNICVTGYQGFSLPENLQDSSIYRPQDLMKARNVFPDSVEAFFGHTALFHEVAFYICRVYTFY